MKLVPQIFIFLLLFTCQAVAGPLETSFTDDIPKNINFGDTPQTIIETMGRAPDPGDEGMLEDGRLVYAYYIDAAMGTRMLGYAFGGNSLISIMWISSGGIDSRLESLYGQPKVDIKEFPKNGKNELARTYELKIWEFKNNAVILGPLHAPRRMVLVCPVDPEGQYDLSMF